MNVQIKTSTTQFRSTLQAAHPRGPVTKRTRRGQIRALQRRRHRRPVLQVRLDLRCARHVRGLDGGLEWLLQRADGLVPLAELELLRHCHFVAPAVARRPPLRRLLLLTAAGLALPLHELVVAPRVAVIDGVVVRGLATLRTLRRAHVGAEGALGQLLPCLLLALLNDLLVAATRPLRHAVVHAEGLRGRVRPARREARRGAERAVCHHAVLFLGAELVELFLALHLTLVHLVDPLVLPATGIGALLAPALFIGPRVVLARVVAQVGLEGVLGGVVVAALRFVQPFARGFWQPRGDLVRYGVDGGRVQVPLPLHHKPHLLLLHGAALGVSVQEVLLDGTLPHDAAGVAGDAGRVRALHTLLVHSALVQHRALRLVLVRRRVKTVKDVAVAGHRRGIGCDARVTWLRVAEFVLLTLPSGETAEAVAL
eukprot:PhM_4_TR8081/c0_g1_i1/m.5989